MALKPAVGRYPDGFHLWDTETPKMTIINRRDFPENEILTGLGIKNSLLAKGFGNCDPREASERSEVMRYLHGHPELMNKVNDLLSCPEIPVTESEFCTYFDPRLEHNPFWEKFHNLVSFLGVEEANLPHRLKVLYDTLTSFIGLEESERKMSEVISEVLKTTAVIEGIAKVEVSIVYEEKRGSGQEESRHHKGKEPELLPVIETSTTMEEMHGHRTFSFALSETRKKEYPSWTAKKWHPFVWLGIGKLVRSFIDSHNERERERAYSMMIIENSYEVREDVAFGVRQALTLLDPSALQLLDGTFLWVHFAFGIEVVDSKKDSKEKLRLQLLDVESSSDHYKDLSFRYPSFQGYSKERRDIITKAQEKIRSTIDRQERFVQGALIRQKIEIGKPDFFQLRFVVPSPSIDRVHKWGALYNLYRGPELGETFAAIENFRKFVSHHLTNLTRMSEILKAMKKRAEELKAPICFPEIVLDGSSVISFESLYPMHFGQALKAKQVVPINGIPEINGDMIGLTGTHGGGKTVTEHTITGCTFLAQSGLPVFGERLRLSCKTHLGMVFIEGVSGESVCQVLIRKMTDIFEGIDGVPGENVLLVLDELGSATQESAGRDLALRVLEQLKQRRVSLIFSTQILGVAEEAQNRFGAKCFKVDDRHRLSPGIAGGNLESLVKEAGLARFLNN